MRVVVFGATGNVGTALVRALLADDHITSIVGVARRPPAPHALSSDPRLTWTRCDIADDPLDVVDRADAVVDLAWQIQPSRDEAALRRTNVIGTARVARAVADHRIPAFVYASSVGTYAAHPKHPRVDESWAASGIESSMYSRHKAEVETMLDAFEADHPAIRVVRMRTSLVFQRSAASEIHRLFLGRFLPWRLPRPLRLVPRLDELQFQATHADDIADAYVRVVKAPVRGAFNVAAEPVLDGPTIARAVGGRTLPVPRLVLRFATSASYAARLQPSEPGWLDMATAGPLMDCRRILDETGWIADRSSVSALTELLAGMGDGAGGATVPLQARSAAS
jgi:UDP-glucose 4-epimerase